MSLTLRAAALHPTVASCSSRRRSGPGRSSFLPLGPVAHSQATTLSGHRTRGSPCFCDPQAVATTQVSMHWQAAILTAWGGPHSSGARSPDQHRARSSVAQPGFGSTFPLCSSSCCREGENLTLLPSTSALCHPSPRSARHSADSSLEAMKCLCVPPRRSPRGCQGFG